MKFLELLSGYRIFDLEWRGDHFTIVQGCDHDFQMDFTPDQLIELANELIAMADQHQSNNWLMG